MEEKEFFEREFYVNEEGYIYDNSVNLNLEDSKLNVSDERIKEIFDNQDEEIKEYLKELKEYKGE